MPWEVTIKHFHTTLWLDQSCLIYSFVMAKSVRFWRWPLKGGKFFRIAPNKTPAAPSRQKREGRDTKKQKPVGENRNRVTDTNWRNRNRKRSKRSCGLFAPLHPPSKRQQRRAWLRFWLHRILERGGPDKIHSGNSIETARDSRDSRDTEQRL